MASGIPIQHAQQHQTIRRESIAHSQGMGGVSWGSYGVNNWLRDEMFHPSQHHASSPGNSNFLCSSYYPNLEAGFCKDYRCCGIQLKDMHDLLKHCEELHLRSEAHHNRPITNRKRSYSREAVNTDHVFLRSKGGQNMDQYYDDEMNDITDQHNDFNDQHNNDSIEDDIDMDLDDVDDDHEDEDESRQKCINDPAKHLYVTEQDELNKPFKCPVVGCEKSYKNQNGLKYHRTHGHQNQKLQLNSDGTYTVIDPLSNEPCMEFEHEKDKPYRCEVCGKRYKNLNGLKYHRSHSTH